MHALRTFSRSTADGMLLDMQREPGDVNFVEIRGECTVVCLYRSNL